MFLFLLTPLSQFYSFSLANISLPSLSRISLTFSTSLSLSPVSPLTVYVSIFLLSSYAFLCVSSSFFLLTLFLSPSLFDIPNIQKRRQSLECISQGHPFCPHLRPLVENKVQKHSFLCNKMTFLPSTILL
jgi:hypothetical protein